MLKFAKHAVVFLKKNTKNLFCKQMTKFWQIYHATLSNETFLMFKKMFSGNKKTEHLTEKNKQKLLLLFMTS